MRRFHLIEIEDQEWCPRIIRDFATDYLQYSINTMRVYSSIRDRLARALAQSDTHKIVDLCSGGGGPWLTLQPEFEAQNFPVEVCLTDRYQNITAFKHAQAASNNKISFYPESVNALRLPPDLTGFRTLFTSFHHFRPADAQAILRDAVKNRAGIGIFEVTQRKLLAIIAILFSPLITLLVTPAIRPFRWSRLFWTYIIPLVPFLVVFDGVVSCLRSYTPAELEAFTREFAEAGYQWEIGEAPVKNSPMPVTYLIGIPPKS